MNKLLEETITQAQKTLEQSKDWNKPYEEQANTLIENKPLLDQFYKQVKNYEIIQFYLVGVNPSQDNIFTVQARYQGQPIATIILTKDTTKITTDTYNESNKKIYNCEIQLKDQDLNTKETIQFLNYFNKEITPKGKIDEKAHIESMLLAEFSKTSSYDKLLTGIQPIKYSNLFYPIPVIPAIAKTVQIKILTRTKVRKITIIEVMDENQTPEATLEQATSKAVFLCNLLHSAKGQEWYKIFGFHGRVLNHITVKVCIAVPKKLATKYKKFEPYELRIENDSIEYHYMEYDTDEAKITSINTTLNE